MNARRRITVVVLFAALAWLALWVSQVDQCRGATTIYCVD